MVGKRQKSSNELKNAVVKMELAKRSISSPVLSAAEVARKAKDDEQEFAEFARLLRGEQNFPREVEHKKSQKPRNLMSNLNEDLNDSLVDSSKPLMPALDDFDQDLDEDEMAKLEAEAVKTLGTFFKSNTDPVPESKIPNIPPQNSSNFEDDFDDIVNAIPLGLLSGECFDSNVIPGNIVGHKTATNLPSTSSNISKLTEKLNAVIPKKRPAPDNINTGNAVDQPPAQKKATSAEIEQKKQEAIRRRKAFLENQQRLKKR